MSKRKEVETTFDEAFDALWDIQRGLEEEHLDSPETTQAILTLDKLLRTAAVKYSERKPQP